MDASSLVLLAGGVINLLLAVAIYFIVKKLARRSLYAKRWSWLAVVVWYAMPLPYIWLKFNVLPLPSDEQMAQHFYSNRADFDALVKAYRAENSTANPATFWDAPDNIKEIKKRVDVWRLTSESAMTWFDNPYSVEAAERHMASIRSGEINTIKNHSLDGVLVVPNHARSHSFRERAQVSKYYLHIPQIPKVEGGKLWYPVVSSKSRYNEQKYMEMKESLDRYPDNWENGQCFLRTLDQQWFIELCKSY